MSSKNALAVTTIFGPTATMAALSQGSARHGWYFVVTGDEPTPEPYRLEGCDYHGLERQAALDLAFARVCPVRNGARKNIAYLLALMRGAEQIVETDDDNHPYDAFWNERTTRQRVPTLGDTGWINVCRYFSDELVWPRGLPLDTIHEEPTAWENIAIGEAYCPIQSGLADRDPDVDAIFRLTRRLPGELRRDRRVALLSGAWFPFNSQNTTWSAGSHALMYLPSTCSFRVADIWRSFVAQRIAWANGWGILHHGPTLRHDRSPHALMRDFEAEIPGYLHNRRICAELEKLDLAGGPERMGDDLRVCWEALLRMALIESAEMPRLEAWLSDIESLRARSHAER
jgi:hypothetical protein